MYRHAFAVLVLLAALPAGVRAQGLGDVARQEEDRRKAVKKGTAKVYTNKDLGSGGSAPASPAPAAPATAGTAPATPAAGSAPAAPAAPDTAKDQKYWAGRMTELRSQLDRDQTYLDALQSRINALATDFVNRDDPAQRGTIAKDRDRATAELSRLQESMAKTRKAITALEEEARRAGVPAGWLR